MSVEILVGDVRQMLQSLPDQSVNCIVTSPPYFGLRDYGMEGQLGLEPTPDEYVAQMVAVFREARRALRDDGTLWLNIGDSFAANRSYQVTPTKWKGLDFGKSNAAKVPDGMKAKDLIGIPWMLAFALRADGWYLRSEIVWAKPNPMPESVKDRPTNAHEKVFLFAKSRKYYYDADAVKEDAVSDHPSGNGFKRDHRQTYRDKNGARGNEEQWTQVGGKRNLRNVWTITPKPFKGAHFAVFPPELPEKCILAGCPVGGTVLDPFMGSGTTGAVAQALGRKCIGIELNPEYAELARARIASARPTEAPISDQLDLLLRAAE